MSIPTVSQIPQQFEYSITHKKVKCTIFFDPSPFVLLKIDGERHRCFRLPHIKFSQLNPSSLESDESLFNFLNNALSKNQQVNTVIESQNGKDVLSLSIGNEEMGRDTICNITKTPRVGYTSCKSTQSNAHDKPTQDQIGGSQKPTLTIYVVKHIVVQCSPYTRPSQMIINTN